MVNLKPPELDAQYAVLGAVLIDPSIAGEVVQTVRETDFGDATCKTIFAAIRDLYISGSRIDAVVVLHQVGEAYRDYLSQLMDITPTSAAWKSYAAIMREQAQLYRIRALAAELESSVSVDDARGVIAKLHEEMSDKSRRVVSLNEGFLAFNDRLDRQPEYLEFGIPTLDDGKLFASKGDFIVLGARPSIGKTALSIQLARHMGAKQKVGYFSLETDSDKFFDRYLSNASQVDFERIKRHTLVDDDYSYIASAINHDLKSVKFDLIEASGMTVDDIRAMTQAHRYDVIFVDYLQLIRGPERDNYSRVTNISMGLHNLAQQCNVAVIALAQLRRAERMTDRRTREIIEVAPTMSDLRESGQIEQDADIIMLMYLDDPEQRDGDRVLRVVKNKEGRLGHVLLMFDGGRQRFAEREKGAPQKNGQPAPQRTKISENEQMKMPGIPEGRSRWAVV